MIGGEEVVIPMKGDRARKRARGRERKRASDSKRIKIAH